MISKGQWEDSLRFAVTYNSCPFLEYVLGTYVIGAARSVFNTFDIYTSDIRDQ